MAKLDYDEHFDEIEDDIRAKEAKKQHPNENKESGRSVFEAQKKIVERVDGKRPKGSQLFYVWIISTVSCKYWYN